MTIPALKGLVQHVIRLYFNINIAKQLNRYGAKYLLCHNLILIYNKHHYYEC